jgi:valyl-tRNA synthetase
MAEISKTYEPQSVEARWYKFWLDEKCFVADAHSKKPAYSIVIPPPNVTGILHMGHVLNNTIQDILARKARMDGKEVLWLPGTDHAGIATQVQVEKKLKKEEKIGRRELGREKFLERVWEWKEKHGGIIIDQLKRLGASCDWTRERFTMDPEYSKCVTMVFVDLYKKGLIYRGKRMVNWCPATLTALSDEEVIMKEQKGSLYYFKVEVHEEPGRFLTIATTRPETIPGDTAVAVNPKDPRYTAFIGKHVIRPLPAEYPMEKNLIPIVADEHVDFEFGTGVLKVTPAHDKADFDIGQRHKLPIIEVINADGTMNELAGFDLNGHDRFKARKIAAEKLTELGLLEKEEPYTNNVGFSERADVPIEPRLSEQWFLKYPSVKQARDVVADGQMRFYPERWARVYDHWMSNIQDWCISRQLWWGHRIPVWSKETTYLRETGAELHALEAEGFDLSAARTTNLETRKEWTGEDLLEREDEVSDQVIGRFRITLCGDFDSKQIKVLEKNLGFIQDPDVLDTWFSSWLWPFATMGWPQKAETLQKFYPTTDLVTAPEILFFWVARMIMAGFEYMGEMPFKNVYFTGIVRDDKGRKMSKSLGNSPDPLALMAKYSADALRFGVMRSAPLGQDVLFDEQHVELGRNFCTKLWNACRFRQMQGGASQGEIEPRLLDSDDKWILLRLDKAIREITESLNCYKFNEAAQTLYRFFWSEFCDWYLEASKAVFYGSDAAQKANTNAVIDFVLSHTLRLFHPFLPFITEELWHGLGYHEEMPERQGGKTIMNAPWPKPFDHDFLNHYSLDESDERFTQAKYDLITAGRNLRREGNIQSSKRVKFVLKPVAEISAHEREVFKILLNAESLDVNPSYAPPKGTPVTGGPLGEIYLPLEGLIDPAAEKTRLTKEKEKATDELDKVKQKLANPAFTEKVPPAVLEEHKKRLADWESKLAQIQRALEALG